jgi:hypothetical protein
VEQKSVIPAGTDWLEKNIRELSGSSVKRIGDDWALLTAGDTAKSGGNWNTMAVSWGDLGEFWSQDVPFVFIRPHRHTREFVEANSLFTLAFFDKSHRRALTF